MLFGVLFWGPVIIIWINRCHAGKVGNKARVIGSIGIFGLPMLAAISMANWMFIQEPLLSSAAEGDVTKVKFLLAMGANPNVESDGFTPLLYAAGNGKESVVRLLLASGADPNEKSLNNHKTAIDLAREGQHIGIVHLLQKAGAK